MHLSSQVNPGMEPVAMLHHNCLPMDSFKTALKTFLFVPLNLPGIMALYKFKYYYYYALPIFNLYLASYPFVAACTV